MLTLRSLAMYGCIDPQVDITANTNISVLHLRHSVQRKMSLWQCFVFLQGVSLALAPPLEEARRFEEGLQDQKDFLYIQRSYVSSVWL